MPQPSRQLDLDTVLEAIRADRQELGACTTGSLVRRTGFSATLVQRRLREAKELDLIAWDRRVPGSIRPSG